MRYDPPSAVRRAALSHGAVKRALLSAIFIASLTCAARAEINSQQPESARAHALDIAFEVLPDELVTDIAWVGAGYPPGDRPYRTRKVMLARRTRVCRTWRRRSLRISRTSLPRLKRIARPVR